MVPHLCRMGLYLLKNVAHKCIVKVLLSQQCFAVMRKLLNATLTFVLSFTAMGPRKTQ